MKLSRKVFFVTLILILAAGSLFAGGGGQAGGGGSADSLELWSVQTSGNGPARFNAAAERFKIDNPTTNVNISFIANDSYKQRLVVALASGQAPDCFFSWSGGPMYEYAVNGQIKDLTPYMNANNYKAKFLDAAVAQASYQGKIWAVPTENVSVCSFFYNKDIFARYNLKVPTTIRELEAVCDTLKRNGITPFSLANKTQWTGSMYFMFFATRRGGTQPFIKGVDGSGTFLDPAFIYAGEKIQEWVNKGYFNIGFNGLDEDSGQSRQIMYREEAAMHLNGSWFNMNAQAENPAFHAKMGAFKLPRDEQSNVSPDIVIGTVGDSFYHVSASSKNPDKAFDLITRLIDDEGTAFALTDGRIPPIKGVKLDDPILAQLFEYVQAAPDIQLWYDQSLSPAVADVHKITSQEIFGGTLTPQAAGQQLQDAQAAYLKK